MGHFNDKKNGGFLNRRLRFLKYDKIQVNPSKSDPLTKPQYRSDPVTFMGKLKTNFENCRAGLIPNTEVIIEICFAKEDFPVWSPYSNDVPYMLLYEKCLLYVGVAQLNKDINNHLESHLARKAALYYYREMRCNAYPIAKGTVDYMSPDLQAPTQATIKLYAAFVLRIAAQGHQHENP